MNAICVTSAIMTGVSAAGPIEKRSRWPYRDSGGRHRYLGRFRWSGRHPCRLRDGGIGSPRRWRRFQPRAGDSQVVGVAHKPAKDTPGNHIVYKICKNQCNPFSDAVDYEYDIPRNGESRPKSQIRTCNSYYGRGEYVVGGCGWQVVQQGLKTNYQARLKEERLIRAYYDRHGRKCPPGHRGRVCT